MKNFKLNLKGLYGYSQSLSPRTLQPSDEREKSERQPREERTLLLLTRRIWKYAAMLIMLLSLGVGNVWARTYSGEEILYVKNIKPANWSGTWVVSNGVVWAVFDGAKATKVEGAKLTGTHGDENVIYAFQVPNGTHSKVTLYRGENTTTEWNKTDEITLDATKNYISGGYTENSSGATWDNFSLNFKKDQKLYLKSNDNWRAASAKLEIYLWDGSHSTWITFQEKIDDTDYHCITIPDRNWAYGIVVRRPNTSSGSTDNFTNVWNQTNDIRSSTDATKNCIVLNSATNNGNVTWETIYSGLTAVSAPVSAASAPSISPTFTASSVSVTAASANTGYHFVNWTSSNGSFETATSSSTTFTPSAQNAVATANYALTNYTITYNLDGGTNHASNPSTYNYETATITLQNPTKTGYNFGDWYTDAEKTVTGKTIVNHSTGDKTFYATWTPKTTTISFNVDGGSSIANETATYDAAMPSISKPTKDGYSFNGIYDAAEGGTQYYDENVASARAWDKEDASVTLYAHWTKSVLTGITLDPTYAVQNEHPDITITPTLSISSGIGTTSICWGLYSDSECTSEVGGVTFSPDPSSGANTVTFTAPDAAGTYYIKADFKAGSSCSGTLLNSVTQSFTVYPTHTVTIAAKVGETTIPADEYTPTNRTVNTYRADAITAPVIAGYDFVNWTLGDNMAKTDGDLTANPIHITATAASTLTANYTYTSYTVNYPSAAGYTIRGQDASVPYKSTGQFTIQATDGYTIEVTAADESGSVSLSQNGDLYSFVQGTSAVTINVATTELNNTITIVNGTETGGSATEVTATAATTTASVTANAAPEGKKFAYWAIDNAISITSGSTTTRSITFNATRSTTITAVYTNRESKTVHFAKPFGWTTVTAVFSNSGSDESEKTEAKRTMTYQGANYYTFSYYTDNNNEGDDKSAQANWNQVVFSDDGDGVKTKTITSITNGYYYAQGSGESAGRATPFAEWYLRGDLNGSPNWFSGDLYKYPFEVEGTSTSATYAYGASAGDAQFFRIYRVSTDEWFAYNITTAADVEFPLDETQALSLYTGSYANKITTPTDKLGAYVFTLTNINTAAPSLTITHPADRTFTDISVSAGANGSISSATEAITELGRYMPTDISATADAGYRFKEWVATGGVVVENPTSASTRATATADGGTLTATFTNEGIVYLDLSAITSWENNTPTVYFYSGPYWDTDNGSGSKNILYGGERMTRIGGTHVWYYDYSGTSMGIGGTKNYIAFTDHEQDGTEHFSSCSAIYRGDFYPEMNMFVPQSSYVNKNSAAYYNNGYWMKYNDAEAGYRLRIYDGQGLNLQQTIPFITATPGSRDAYEATFHVSGAADAKFELVGYDQGTVNGVSYAGTFYGNTGSINSNLDSWWYFEPDKGKTNIKLISKGDYVFKLQCGTDGKLYVKVSYPLATGDFRIKYNGLRTTTADAKTDVYSDAIPRLTENGTREDTVSFFVYNSGDNTATLSAEKVLSIASDGTITWVTSDVSLTGAAISGLEADVYTFKITQTKSGGTYTLSYENLGAYNGNYYVRTDWANGGWVDYKQADNTLHPTNYAGAGYNAYFCRYIPNGSVKFCIANQYNSALTEEKAGDINANASGTIIVSANTRFEYDTTTNVVSRSYIGGSNVATYLYIRDAAPDKIFKDNGTTEGITLTNDTAKLIDQENWIYMLDVKASTQAQYTLEARINGNTQYFVGTESTAETLINAAGASGKQKLRLVYDFKNNHMITAWLPSTGVNGNIPIEADVMLLREGQNQATQLNFTNADSKLTQVKNVYGVLGFKKSDLTDDDKASYEKSLYWISFPFDVKVKDIFGFGTYGEDFIVRRYNGAKRAQIGWFKDTDTFWETMDPNSEIEAENTMKAYEGYMVALDRGLQDEGDNRWTADGKAISELYLYFPSTTTVGTLSQTNKEITLDSLSCRIDRPFAQDPNKNHKITDSNWRVIGIGSLHNSKLTAKNLNNGEVTLSYYNWTASSNSLSPTVSDPDATTYKAGHAVMVQFAGKITWTNASVPASVAARRVETEKKNYTVELDLNYNGSMADRTYVVLQENASADFVLNEDLYKATNANLPNVYAYAGAYDCGVSIMPIESTTVPVGVITRKKGSYTFSMPSDFSGTVTLVDSFAQTRTNLAVEDYTVDLEKGTINDRFCLELDIQAVTTNLDQTSDGFTKDKTRKVMIDGILYIVKDGKMYDARGNKVK